MVIVRESGALKTKDTWETLNRPFYYVTNPNLDKPEKEKIFITKARKDENTKKDKIIISCFPYFVFS